MIWRSQVWIPARENFSLKFLLMRKLTKWWTTTTRTQVFPWSFADGRKQKRIWLKTCFIIARKPSFKSCWFLSRLVSNLIAIDQAFLLKWVGCHQKSKPSPDKFFFHFNLKFFCHDMKRAGATKNWTLLLCSVFKIIKLQSWFLHKILSPGSQPCLLTFQLVVGQVGQLWSIGSRALKRTGQ